MRGASSIFILTTLLAACHPKWPAPEVPFEGPEAIDTYLDAFLSATGGPPSISVAISLDGEVVLARAMGWADEQAEVSATPETSYRSYSISKAITAVAVMQLVESGAVSLDDRIRSYVPEFSEKSWPIHVEHLLSHTSGIRHYKSNAGEISSTTEYPSLADSLVVFADDPLEFEPGSAIGYTSFGFNLLTGVVESVSGVSFGDYLAAKVFGPAGAANSRLDRVGSSDPSLARAYWSPATRFTGNRPIDRLPNVSGRYGSSGVVSTPTDLVRLLIALEDGRLLRPETLDLMLAVPYPELADYQALGWNVDGEGCRRMAFRSGAGTGYTGLLIHYPALRLGGAVLVNQNQWQGRSALLRGILDHYLDRIDGCPGDSVSVTGFSSGGSQRQASQ